MKWITARRFSYFDMVCIVYIVNCVRDGNILLALGALAVGALISCLLEYFAWRKPRA